MHRVWMCIFVCIDLCQSLIAGINKVTTFSWSSVCVRAQQRLSLVIYRMIMTFSWWAKFGQLIMCIVCSHTHTGAHTLQPMLTLPFPTWLCCFSSTLFCVYLCSRQRVLKELPHQVLSSFLQNHPSRFANFLTGIVWNADWTLWQDLFSVCCWICGFCFSVVVCLLRGKDAKTT